MHVASGAVVMLCLATFRWGGHCVTASEVVGYGERTSPHSTGVPSPLDTTPRFVSAVEANVEAGADIPWSRVLHEVAPDVGLELAELAVDGLTTSPALLNFVNFGEVRCPGIIDISGGDVDGWNSLKVGHGIDCAPIVVLGFSGADGRSMRHAGGDIPIAWYAGECLHLGARCTLVACGDDACIAEAHASFRGIQRVGLSPYLGEFFARLVRQSAPPVVLAQPGAVDGRPIVTVAGPRPVDTPRVDHDSSSVRQIRQ